MPKRKDPGALLEKRAAILRDARSLMDSINEKTSEDDAKAAEAKFDDMLFEAERLFEQAKRMQRGDELLDSLNDPLPQEMSGLRRVGPADRSGFHGHGVSTPDSGWRDAQGRNVTVLRPEQRWADHVPVSSDNSSPISFGAYCRAMTLGPRNEAERRALAEGSDSTGGYTVPTATLARLIDKMRNRTVAIRAGAETVPLSTDQNIIARIDTDATAAWRAENSSVAVSDLVFGGVTLAPKSLACIVKVSRELLQDSLNIEDALEMSFAGAMAVELDRVALVGSGTPPEPEGISSNSGISEISMGDDGAIPTNYSQFLEAFQTLAGYNVDLSMVSAVMSPRTYFTYAAFLDEDTNPRVPPWVSFWNPGYNQNSGGGPASPDFRPSLYYSNSISNTMTQGTATSVASQMILGDFTKLMIGVRQELRVEVLKETYAGDYQYGFLAHLRADVALAQPTAFAKIVGILAS